MDCKLGQDPRHGLRYFPRGCVSTLTTILRHRASFLLLLLKWDRKMYKNGTKGKQATFRRYRLLLSRDRQRQSTTLGFHRPWAGACLTSSTCRGAQPGDPRASAHPAPQIARPSTWAEACSLTFMVRMKSDLYQVGSELKGVMCVRPLAWSPAPMTLHTRSADDSHC